jgi:glyoxylase-like metal-dependent hydrolase (beta-lactamase superfamily II)
MSVLTKITAHVYWMPPGPPDRPSLCAVVGDRRTLMLDAGSSTVHAGEFLDALSTEGAARPSAVVYTHSHWDHVFGGSELSVPVVAHQLTAATLIELATMDWSDEALDERVAAGEASEQHAANVKEELPSPRAVEVAPADIIFQDGLDLELGGVSVRVRHVGGDHAADSCVMFVEPDSVLFLGDCLYEAPSGGYTADRLPLLIETVRAFGAGAYVEGHHETVLSRAEIDEQLEEARTILSAG